MGCEVENLKRETGNWKDSGKPGVKHRDEDQNFPYLSSLGATLLSVTASGSMGRWTSGYRRLSPTVQAKQSLVSSLRHLLRGSEPSAWQAVGLTSVPSFQFLVSGTGRTLQAVGRLSE